MTPEAQNQRRSQLRAEAAVIEDAMHAAVQDVLILHKRAGQPVVTWENGQVILIPADQISINGGRAAH